MKKTALLAVALCCSGAYGQVMQKALWDHPLTQTNGAVVLEEDIWVTVYWSDGAEACSGPANGECYVEMNWEQCATFYATARQISTDMVSERSEEVNHCAGPLPALDSPPSAPMLRFQLFSG